MGLGRPHRVSAEEDRQNERGKRSNRDTLRPLVGPAMDIQESFP